MRHHGPRADKRAAAEPDAANDGRVCTDAHTFLNPSLLRPPIGAAASRRAVIGQDRVRADEYVVSDMHVFPDGHAVFDGDVVTNYYACLNESVVPDIAVAADDHASLHVRERPNAGAFAHPVCLNQGIFVNE